VFTHGSELRNHLELDTGYVESGCFLRKPEWSFAKTEIEGGTMPRRHLNGAGQSLNSSPHQCAAVDSTKLDMEHAKAEIERLKLELAQARDELESLTEATSDFVRLML
jgi:hypothetical protein